MHRYNSSLGIIQGGDIQFGNGSGGASFWGKKFKDDVKGLKLKHDKRGVLSMGNGGKNSNTSQFFVCWKGEGAPVCDKKHVVFGQLVHGFDTLDLMQELVEATDGSPGDPLLEESPPVSMVITGCGEWVPGSSPVQGYYDAADVFQELLTDRREKDA